MSDTTPVTSPAIRVTIFVVVSLMACAMIGLVLGAIFYTRPYF